MPRRLADPLLHAGGTKVAGVSYTKAQAQEQGWMVTFPGLTPVAAAAQSGVTHAVAAS